MSALLGPSSSAEPIHARSGVARLSPPQNPQAARRLMRQIEPGVCVPDGDLVVPVNSGCFAEELLVCREPGADPRQGTTTAWINGVHDALVTAAGIGHS